MSAETTQGKAGAVEMIRIAAFYLHESLCGIDISHVQEIHQDLTFTKVPLAPEYVQGIMNLRGQIVTVIDQSLKIGLPAATITPESRVVIVKSQGESIGLLVDRIVDVMTTEVGRIAPPPPNIHGAQGEFFKGVIHTDNNELLALLDIEAILRDI